MYCKNKIIKLILISITLLSLISCNESKVYLPNRLWFFETKINVSLVQDFTLSTYKDNFNLNQKKIVYFYKEKWGNGNIRSLTKEKTGVIDGGIFLISNEIWLHPPRTGILRNTELLPFPWVKYPIIVGDIYDWDLTPKIGWGDLKGLKIKGKIKIAGKEYYNYKNIQDSCYVLNCSARSKKGLFTSKYLFSEKYGFLSLKYNLKDTVIDIKCYDTNFN